MNKNIFNDENVQIQPLTIKALEHLQLEISKRHLEDALTAANYTVKEGE